MSHINCLIQHWQSVDSAEVMLRRRKSRKKKKKKKKKNISYKALYVNIEKYCSSCPNLGLDACRETVNFSG